LAADFFGAAFLVGDAFVKAVFAGEVRFEGMTGGGRSVRRLKSAGHCGEGTRRVKDRGVHGGGWPRGNQLTIIPVALILRNRV
jgi:hypothetical protein